MAFPKGRPRPKGAGRAKGTPNKKNVQLNLDLLETLRAKGFDPAAEMVALFQESMIQYKKRTKMRDGWGGGSFLSTAESACRELMRYTYPTRKAIDHTNNGGSFTTFTDFVKAIMVEDEEAE